MLNLSGGGNTMTNRKKIQDTVNEELVGEELDLEEEVVEELGEVDVPKKSKAKSKAKVSDEPMITASVSDIVKATVEAVQGTQPISKESVPLENQISQQTRVVEANRKMLTSKFSKESKVPITISPSYRPYLGTVAMFSINGIAVYIPCDGRAHMVNTSHAALVYETLQKYDADTTRQQRLSNVSNNIDSEPGVPKNA